MISVVCVYNNKEILNKYLLKSLKDQVIDYELILIDNTNSKFKSAAEALNYGGKKANEDYIMFVHQDINLLFENWLKEAEEILNSLKNLGIAGIAGMIENEGGIITNIKEGVPPQLISPDNEIIKPMKVQTLDECLIIIPQVLFSKFNFDEEVCDNWHLYAVDYSLSIKKLGYDVYVLPLPAYHRSHVDSLSKDYYQTLKKILKKYKKEQDMISTTMGNWFVNYPLIIQRYRYSFNRIWTLLNNKINLIQ